MKLIKKDLQSIADRYNLGKINSLYLIKGGLINTNFLVSTSNGNFIIRFLRKKLSKDYLDRKAIEFYVLEEFKKRKFPYKIPQPIKNSSGKIIGLFNSRRFFVYPYISGEEVKKLNNSQIREIAKGLAIYHNYIEKIPLTTNKKNVSDLTWVARNYVEMGKVRPKNKLDRLMKKNLEFFNNELQKNIIMCFKERRILAHGDFQQSNLLFSKNKLIAILDFDNIDWSSRMKDISISIKRVCLTNDYLDQKKIDLFTKEYKKYHPLSKRDILLIKPCILHNYCIIFWWAYNGHMKNEKNRYGVLKRVIIETKNLVEVMP